jgi:hypothetical protein
LQAGLRSCSIPSETQFIQVEQGILARGHPLNAIVASLGAFFAAGVRPQTPLAKAIALVLAIKLIAIAGIGAFMLSGSVRPVVDTIAVSRLTLPDEAGR